MSKEIVNEVILAMSSISNVPYNSYDDFTFIVNDQKYKPTRLVADLISNKISKIHFNDPTIDTFCIQTHNKGNFKLILDLINFKKQTVPKEDILFLAEVFQILESNKITFSQTEKETITTNNIFEQIKQHEQYEFFFKNDLQREINYISSHFYEICENYIEELNELSDITIEKIINNQNLSMQSEDQLLQFITPLYLKDTKYAKLYEYIDFANLSESSMNDFLSIFDIYDVTNQLWDKISMRLKNQFKPKSKKVENDKKMNKRYHNEINVDYDAYKDFKGIINYLQNNSDLGIFHEIKITSSSLYNNDNQYAPSNTIHYQDQNIEFCTSSLDNSWLCFEFCNYKIKPTHYTIRSANYQVNREHPKSWVIEGSNDNKEWIILDEQKDCFSLNGKSVTHTFSITNSTDSKFTFLRMRLIGPNWCKNTKHLNINCIEFYGSLV